MSDQFVDRLRDLIRPERFDAAVELANRYWTATGEQFTGRMFHELADSAHPSEITGQDIAAVSTLNVNIPPRVTIWLLSEEGRASVHCLLDEVPTEVDIWDAPVLVGRDGPLWELWDLLAQARWPTNRPNNGMGRTKMSKLLAAKRPRLVPIWDSVLESLFSGVGNYWDAYYEALNDEELRLQLSIASNGHAPEGASLLRRIDALLWMIGQQPHW